MLHLQLYIDGQEVELHDNESVVITQSLQDVLDIQKVFTDYSRTFNIPASKNNNKIFKHYYNPAIQNPDSLLSRPAELYLNHEPFKSGRIKQESVELKNGQPLNYRITFFGKTMQLKEILGDFLLSDLFELNASFQYTASEVLAKMQNGQDYFINGEAVTDAFLYPLISNNNRLIYNSNDNTVGTYNLYASGQQHGVVYDQLKPAIRLHAILLGIEKQFNLKFSRDFFNANNPDYYNLYLWLHKQKDGVEPEDESETFISSSSNWTNVTGSTDIARGFSTGSGYRNFATGNSRRFITIEAEAPDGVEYTVRVRHRGVFYEGEHTGNATVIALNDEQQLLNTTNVNGLTSSPHYYIEVASSTNATITLNVTIYDRLSSSGRQSATATQTYTFSSAAYNSTISSEMPKMKIMDLLTSLFKMFNLTAYYDGNDIQVLPLDNYYAASTKIYDITKYIDNNKSEVRIEFPFSKVSFRYSGQDTFFTNHHSTFLNEEWGSLEYENTSDNTSQSYDIEVPFEHHKFERFIGTTAQWGWSVDKKREPFLGKPLLFYVHKVTDGTPIQFTETLGGVMHEINDYYIPSNNAIATDDDSQSIHFGAEKNEYTANFAENSLFYTYYRNYIEEIFDPARRLFVHTAFLPLSILVNINLNDKVVIFNRLYKINKLTTNFETNISTLELVNETQDFTFEVEDVIRETVKTVDASIATADITTITADTTILVW